ncbi:acyl-CoA thioesterase [Knoellia remsis]|uniref:Acyl-CoA thioesterase n=1 Tax=Knoellia remsis TaxID=407159 RepID=A0A2T0UJK8_9MICO|nr:thioesterase family protein [Knoellia remsis]PRY58092.1 acyl-CoA thioesterase [Knoellia remsis]
MSYFRRIGESTWEPTEHVQGAWNLDEQHVAPALGVLAHAVEADRDSRRDDGLVLGRLSWDILGTLPMEPCEAEVRVLRPGRTIELVEAVLSHGGRPAVSLRAWLLATRDTAAVSGSPLAGIPAPDETPAWDPTTVWPGGFIASVELRRAQVEPGRAAFWVRSDVPLADEPVSELARAAGLFDIANGMTVRESPQEVHFPNLDLTAHVYREPAGEWLGFDTSVSFGSSGVGLTSSVLHDETGPFGTMSQILTVRPR